MTLLEIFLAGVVEVRVVVKSWSPSLLMKLAAVEILLVGDVGGGRVLDIVEVSQQ